MTIEEYEIFINFHVEDQSSYKVLAENREAAEKIALIMFDKNHNRRCIVQGFSTKKKPLFGET